MNKIDYSPKAPTNSLPQAIGKHAHKFCPQATTYTNDIQAWWEYLSTLLFLQLIAVNIMCCDIVHLYGCMLCRDAGYQRIERDLS